MAKKKTTKKPEPHLAGVEQLTPYRMRPFGFHVEESAYALRLAEVAINEGDDDGRRAALILLVSGVAAIKNAEDRQTLAAEIIRQVFGETGIALEAARQSMLLWEEIPWEKLGSPIQYTYPVSIEQRKKGGGDE